MTNELSIEKKLRKKRNLAAQEKRRAGLKEAGLETLSIVLDKDTFERLNELCVSAGYRDPYIHKHGNQDTYSNMLTSMIMKESGVKLIPQSAVSQRLYKLFRVGQYLTNSKEDDGRGFSESEAAKFFTTHKYARPGHITGDGLDDYSPEWSVEDVEAITNKKEVIALVKRFDGNWTKTTGDAATNKKKPAKPKS